MSKENARGSCGSCKSQVKSARKTLREHPYRKPYTCNNALSEFFGNHVGVFDGCKSHEYIEGKEGKNDRRK